MMGVRGCMMGVRRCMMGVRGCMMGVRGCMMGVRGCMMGVRGCMMGVRGCMMGVRGCMMGVRGCIFRVGDRSSNTFSMSVVRAIIFSSVNFLCFDVRWHLTLCHATLTTVIRYSYDRRHVT